MEKDEKQPPQPRREMTNYHRLFDCPDPVMDPSFPDCASYCACVALPHQQHGVPVTFFQNANDPSTTDVHIDASKFRTREMLDKLRGIRVAKVYVIGRFPEGLRDYAQEVIEPLTVDVTGRIAKVAWERLR